METRKVKSNGQEYQCPIFKDRDTYKISLPFFTGFYQGVYSPDIEYEDIEHLFPDNLGFESQEYIKEHYFDWVDYSEYKEQTSRTITQIISDLLKKRIPDIYEIRYKDKICLIEHNYRNDEILVNIDCNFNKIIDRFLQIENIEQIIKNRWRSSDGYFSFVPDNLREFLFEINPGQILYWMIETIDFDMYAHNEYDDTIAMESQMIFIEDYKDKIISESFNYREALLDILRDKNIWDKIEQQEDNQIYPQDEIYKEDFQKFNLV